MRNLRKYLILFILTMPVTILSCGSSAADKDEPEANISKKEKKYTQFKTGYGKNFNDLPELHISAAEQHGLKPLTSRTDTTKYLASGKLVRVPMELEVFKVDNLTHSIPYLVPEASFLLADIGVNFRDSLISKKLPLYKPIVTSIMRTDEDVKKLTRRNVNASDQSVHRFGTTFDISWVRFEKVDPIDKRTMDDGRLKFILAQVLHDLRQRDRCYIKHERKQPCFHITVR